MEFTTQRQLWACIAPTLLAQTRAGCGIGARTIGHLN